MTQGAIDVEVLALVAEVKCWLKCGRLSTCSRKSRSKSKSRESRIYTFTTGSSSSGRNNRNRNTRTRKEFGSGG